MKKCVFIANCQQGPIKFLLRSVAQFNALYEIKDITPVHLWSPETTNGFPAIYNEADVIFTQPVFDDRYGLACTSKLAEFNKNSKNIPIIIYPNVEFMGFFPFATRIPIRCDKVFAPDSQCGIVLWCFINGYDRARAIKFCADFYNDDSNAKLYQDIYGIAVKRLEKVEITLAMDINASYLFRTRYTKDKLMLNRWHPTNIVYSFLANRLLTKLGIYENPVIPKREFLLQDEMPISSAVKNALGIQFDDGGCYYYMGMLLSHSEYISALYAFYNENGPTVEAAVKMNEDKLKVIDAIATSRGNDINITPLFHW